MINDENLKSDDEHFYGYLVSKRLNSAIQVGSK
jgi:hypothetical protein